MDRKTLVVEGATDREAIEPLLAEDVRFYCTFGTVGYEQLQRISDDLDDDEVYILVDADQSGDKLRGQLKQVLPNARHLYTRRLYREVAATPQDELARILHRAHFELTPHWREVAELPQTPHRSRPSRGSS